MKRIIVAVWSLTLFASVQAAQVSVITPAGAGFPDYVVGGQSYTAVQNAVNAESPGSDYQDRFNDTGLVNTDSNGGEELIWLGLHETIDYATTGGADNVVTVVVDNLNIDGAATAGVSLLFSAAESLAWNVDVAEGVQLNNIYVFGLQEQSITVNGEQVLEDNIFELFGGQTGLVQHSTVAIFGEAFCSPGQRASDCGADAILGINHQGSDSRGRPVHTNAAGNNYLADLTDQQITSFSGSYFADGFTVGVDSTVVPLPAAALLFASACSLLLGRKFSGRLHNNQSHIR